MEETNKKAGIQGDGYPAKDGAVASDRRPTKPRFPSHVYAADNGGTILTPGRPELVKPWMDKVSDFIEQNFTVHRDIVIRRVYENDPAEINPPGGQAGQPSMEVYKLRLQQRFKKVQDLQESRRKIFSVLWARLSEESRDRVIRSGLVADPIDRDDPLLLLQAIEASHLSRDYSGNQMKDRRSARDHYLGIRQFPRESVIDYKNRFQAALSGMTTAGATLPSQAEQIQDFVEGLDRRRFAQLVVDLANRVIAFPTSVDGARRLAESRFEVSRDRDLRATAQTGRAIQAAFLSTAEKRSVPLKQKRPFACSLCDAPDHPMFKCPFIEKARRAVQSKVSFDMESAHVTTQEEDESQGYDEDYADDIEDIEDVDDYCGYMATKGIRGFAPLDVLLDNQASHSIVHNESLLRDVRQLDPPVTFRGYGGSKLVHRIGEIPGFGPAFLDPSSPANLISLSQVEDMYPVQYVQGRHYAITTEQGEFKFERRANRHYTCDFRPFVNTAGTKMALVTTVEEKEALYTKREVSKAREARELIRKMGFPSTGDAVKALGHIAGVDITAQDMYRAQDIYGPDAAQIKGKLRSQKVKGSPTRLETILPSSVQREQVLFADIATIEGQMFVVTLSSPLGLIVVSVIASKSAETMFQELSRIVNQYVARNFTIVRLQTDPEAVFLSLAEQLRHLGVVLDPCGVNKHVPEIEVRIRIIKERCRCILNDLPYSLPSFLIPHLLLFVVSRLNGMPSNLRIDPTSPREIFANRKLTMRDLAVGFGEYCIVEDFPQVKNSMEPRALESLSMNPLGNSQGSIQFFVIETGVIIARDHWKALPMPKSIVEAINAIANAAAGKSKNVRRSFRPSKFTSGVPVERHPGPTYVSKTSIPMVYLDDVADEELGTSQISRAEDAVAQDVSNTNSAYGDVEETPLLVPPVENDLASAYKETENAYDQIDPAEPAPAGTDLIAPEHHVLQVSLAKARRSFGDNADRAAEVELQQMELKGVWTPVSYDTLSADQRKATIRSFMFLKEKVDAAGKFEKLKARLVAGGNGQDASLYDNKSSPTATTQAIFLVATIAAKEKRSVVTADIGSAYLNADMKDSVVHMLIDSNMAQILLKIAPAKYENHVRRDGGIVVRLKKALYGCIESARLWYETLRDSLVEYGFVINPYENCVFNKSSGDYQLTVVVYVDDLLITSEDNGAIDAFIDFLKRKFGTVTEVRGAKHSYLGMLFDFSDSGRVSVSMEGFVNDILKVSSVEGRAATPATARLFDVSEIGDKVQLLDQHKAKTFHSLVAKLLYLAKRTRPDTLTAVCFLTTRVSAPTTEDHSKLLRVLCYLNGSRDLSIVLENVSNQLTGYIDASYAVHPDMRSHTGIFITLGKGPIFIGSSKQKLNAKSSTEAEIIALSDKMGDVIWIQDFLKHQCPSAFTDAAVIFQDNTSAITLVKKGKAMSSATRHINIRFFFVKEKVGSGIVRIEHISTGDMIADVLTKPLQGAIFRRLRQLLLNCP